MSDEKQKKNKVRRSKSKKAEVQEETTLELQDQGDIFGETNIQYDYPEGYDDYYYDEEYEDEEYYEEEAPKSIGRTVAYMLTVLLVAVVLAILMWFAADDVLSLTKSDNVITVVVEETDTFDDVTQKLHDRGLVRYKFLFKLYGKIAGAEDIIEPGTFELNQLFDYHALVNALASGSESRKTVTLTFPEGYTCDQIFEMLETNQVCTKEDLEDTAANYEFDYTFLQALPYGEENRLEGYLFPDTYEFYVNDDPARVISKFLANFEKRFTEDMEAEIQVLNASIRERMENEGSFTEEEIENAMMDVNKIVIVASLIEKEAGSDQERDMISSVIYNRLNTRVHELLQIDATVVYALGGTTTKLTENDLAVDDPYNTYRNKGLPPGPIANPGINSIMAALNPRETDFYFYALNSGGTHTFFETYEEHREYVSIWKTETVVAEPDEAAETPVEEPAEEEVFYEEVPVEEGEDGTE